MNRRTFLKTLSAIPFVGLVLPKERAFGGDNQGGIYEIGPFSELKNNCKTSPLVVGDKVYGPDGRLYICTTVGSAKDKFTWSTQAVDWGLTHGLQEKR